MGANLEQEVGLDRFFVELGRARRRVLLIDYDGCLAPYEADRHRALPHRAVRERLRALVAEHGTRLVIVTGRRAAELPPLLGLSPTPEIWGAHGLERRLPDGHREEMALPKRERSGLERAEREARRRGLGGLLERKNGELALHWRGLDADAAHAVRREALRIWSWAPEHGLELRPFDGGLELRLAGVSRARVVAALCAEGGPATSFAYLAADASDVAAFAAVPETGLAVLVAERAQEVPACWVRPDDLVAFFDRWLAATAPGAAGAQRGAGVAT